MPQEKHISASAPGEYLYVDSDDGSQMMVETLDNGALKATYFDANGNEDVAGDNDAHLFYRELFETYDSLCQIADELGVTTLADIVYLSNCILTGSGFVDSHESKIQELIDTLPSAGKWSQFLHDGPRSIASFNAWANK